MSFSFLNGSKPKVWLEKTIANSKSRLVLAHSLSEIKILQLILIYVAFACSLCGFLWSFFIANHLGFCITALIPLTFPIAVLPVAAWSLKKNSFDSLALAQCLGIILVPAAIQFSLGSAYSGAVMLWGVIAPLCALFYLNQGKAILLFFLYMTCVVSSTVFDIRLTEDFRLTSEEFISQFYVVNIVFPSSIVSIALWYLVSELSKSQDQMHGLLKDTQSKHKDLIDSINYSQRLQQATLPSFERFKHYFPQSFLFESPKDIVSGDFFWHVEIDNRHYFAVADATGHGVPGALMSVICNNALYESIMFYEITDVADILKSAKSIIVNSLANENGAVRDGMDIALCCYQDGFLHFAGAKSTLFLYRNRSKSLETTRGNRQSVGNDFVNKQFTTFLFKIERGDRLYLTTDGYLDQFGGIEDRKFRTSNFKKTIVGTQQIEMTKQNQVFADTLARWRDNNDQLDDICVLGLEFS